MSFKRDGDDENLLKNLNHQRVKELLGSHIPQDEAKLLSNGRLACMICLHRPVFDTINMLSIHRKGKKHLLELSKYIQCKEDAVIKDLQRKRPYTDVIAGDEESSAKMTEPNLVTSLAQSPILGSRHVASKQNMNKLRRKPVLEIQPTLSTKVPVLSSTEDTNLKSASATVRHYLKSISRKSSLEKVIEKNRDNYGVDLQKDLECKRTEIPSSGCEMHVSIDENLGNKELTQKEQSDNETKDYEMRLRMSGWIKDVFGKWVKDPNVEFDSDEDDIPTPTV